MTQTPPPGPPRARIPGPRRVTPPRRRAPRTTGPRHRCRQAGVTLWVLTAPAAWATGDSVLPAALLLLGALLNAVAFALHAYERHDHDPT